MEVDEDRIMAVEIVDKKVLVWEHPVIVWAERKIQFGQPYLAGSCPECGTPANLNREGKHVCYQCNRCLEFRDKAKKPTFGGK